MEMFMRNVIIILKFKRISHDYLYNIDNISHANLLFLDQLCCILDFTL